MSELLLSLQRAGKDYKGQTVLNDATLSIHKGETIAIIGQNGSGKSTLLKLAGGLIRLSRGQRVIHRRGGKLSIGYMPDRFPKIRMTGWAYLHHMGAIGGIPRQQLKERITTLMEQLELGFDAVNRPCHQYSKGMLQKINIIQAVLKPPDLLLLDEPLSGLDAHSQKVMVDMLSTLKQEGTAIVLTSHEQKMVSHLAHTIMTIAEGRLVQLHASGRDQSSRSCKIIAFTLPKEIEAAAWIARQKVRVDHHTANRWICRVEELRSDEFLKAILDCGGHVESVETASM